MGKPLNEPNTDVAAQISKDYDTGDPAQDIRYSTGYAQIARHDFSSTDREFHRRTKEYNYI